MSRYPKSLAALAAASVLATAACGSAQEDDVSSGEGIANCGFTVEVDKAPERAVTLDQNSLEILLELGLGDRVHGTANLRTDVPERYQDEFEGVEVLNDSWLTAEQLREAAPDFVYSGFKEHYSKDGVGTREELADLGLPTYASSVSCPEMSEGDTAFDRLFTDYANIGEVFGVEDRASDLVDAQQQKLDDAAEAGEKIDGLKVAWVYSFAEGQPYVAGNDGIPQALSDTMGVENVFADVDEAWPEVSIDEIALREPDVIVLGDISERGMPGDSASDKIDELRDNPVTSQMDAVKEDRLIEVPGIAMDPSVRSVDVLDQFVEGLQKLGYVD
ncbi:ABC transporter substrate-binding protein [Salininema proteolyticum]|uniref:ABC transporter substrate-binding protein n=1 Tax=Salininema proteolyticum TaxID=1607685 RepID=A0ABV8TUV0_9ACTN